MKHTWTQEPTDGMYISLFDIPWTSYHDRKPDYGMRCLCKSIGIIAVFVYIPDRHHDAPWYCELTGTYYPVSFVDHWCAIGAYE